MHRERGQHWAVASVHLGLGQKEPALSELEEMYNLREPNLPNLNAYPEFQSLRGHPRFIALVTKMGLPPAAPRP